MTETVCIGHGGLDAEGNSRCGCKEFAKYHTDGFYETCVCGASKDCHLSPDSKYITGKTKKSRK